jgi:hypothetical protein
LDRRQKKSKAARTTMRKRAVIVHPTAKAV